MCTARLLDGLAAQLRRRGRYGLAVVVHRRAVAIARSVLDAGDPELAAIANNLGVACKYAGRLDEAECAYRTAMDTLTQAGATDTVEMASFYQPRWALACAWPVRRGRGACS